jgi:tetratricopeptide (TPR) repeat protein
MAADGSQLTRDAHALKAQGRLDDAIALYRQALAVSGSAVAEHNLAGALGDAGRWREAEPHLRQSFAKGNDAPETWLVLARCLQGLGRLDESDAAFREALKRRPHYADAHRELAQLRWMRMGDFAAATSDLDAALRAAPRDPGLIIVKASALEFAGRLHEAHALLDTLAAANPGDAYLLTLAAQAAVNLGKPDLALPRAEAAARLAPSELVPRITLIETLLASGDAQRASHLAEQLRISAPDNQHAIALQATAWRLLGDPRYRTLHDYDALVWSSLIDTPAGWPNLPAYLADLAAALRATHAYREHPFNQSLRHGSQAADLLHHPHPAVQALQQALDGPIRRRIAELGSGPDPLRARNRGGYAHQGMWSVRLNPNGFHIDHVHPKGWLSSACYIETVKGDGREGWIKFGQPGVKTRPSLDAEHWVKPEPGLLVLFPSYMWHGTVPFTGDQSRLTVAFDLAPAAD